MGYYAKYGQPSEEVRGYPSSLAQLLWRLDDLQDRYEALSQAGALYDNSERMVAEELRFVLPADLETVEQVEEAICLAQEDLYTDYGIDVTAPPQEDSVWETQLCLFAMPELLSVA